MFKDNNLKLLSSMQQTLLRMEECLTTVIVDVENLKCTQTPVGQGVQLSGGLQSGLLQSNMVYSVISMPENLVGGQDDDNFITCLTWEEQMELEDAKLDADKVSKSVKHSKSEKLHLKYWTVSAGGVHTDGQRGPQGSSE